MQCEQSKTGSEQKKIQKNKSAVGNALAGVVATLGRNAARLLRPIQYLAWIPAQTFEPSQKRTIGSEDFKIDRNLYSDSWEALIKAREDFTRKNNLILLKDL